MMSIPYEIKQGYIGHPGQLVTLRRVTVAEGKAKGTEIIEVKTAGGLELDILPDAGLDIGQCRYQGVNMSWMSKNGYDSPAVITPYENEFVNTFPAVCFIPAACVLPGPPTGTTGNGIRCTGGIIPWRRSRCARRSSAMKSLFEA